MFNTKQVGSKHNINRRSNARSYQHIDKLLVFVAFVVLPALFLIYFKSHHDYPVSEELENGVSYKAKQKNQVVDEREDDLGYKAMFICRASISLMMNRDITIISAKVLPDNIIQASYIRPEDGTEWKWACRFEGNRMIWAGYPWGEMGRWRTHPKDEKFTYDIKTDGVNIKLDYGDDVGETFLDSGDGVEEKYFPFQLDCKTPQPKDPSPFFQ